VDKSQENGKSEAANTKIKVERSRLVLLGALAATAVAVVGCGRTGGQYGGYDGGYGD